MKCAVAIVLALIGVVASNPVAPLTGLSWAAPPLLPSAAAVINHGYGKLISPIIAPVSVPIVKTIPILKTPVLTAPLSIGYPGYGWGGYGYGNLGYGYGLGWGNWGKAGLGWGSVGYGKGWH